LRIARGRHQAIDRASAAQRSIELTMPQRSAMAGRYRPLPIFS